MRCLPLLSFALLATASPTLSGGKKEEKCCDVKCYKRLEWGDRNGHDVWKECKHYQTVTETPCPSITTKTIHESDVTVTITSMLGKASSIAKKIEAVHLPEPRWEHRPKHHPKHHPKDVCTIPSFGHHPKVPDYACEECKPSDWASACSCLGVPHGTTTLPKSTITKTKTKPGCTKTTTVTVTPTSLSVSCSTSTSISISIPTTTITPTITSTTTATSVCPTATTIAGRMCTPTCGQDRPGGDYANAQLDSFEACIAACAADPMCLTAQYHISSGYCYFKNSVKPMVANPDDDTIDCAPVSMSTSTGFSTTISISTITVMPTSTAATSTVTASPY